LFSFRRKVAIDLGQRVKDMLGMAKKGLHKVGSTVRTSTPTSKIHDLHVSGRKKSMAKKCTVGRTLGTSSPTSKVHNLHAGPETLRKA
jgi:hypothetical protein